MSTDKIPWTSARERWQMQLDLVSNWPCPPKRLKHEADASVVYDATVLLRCFDVLRWSPETRDLIYAAREAVADVERAMWDELRTKEGQ